MKRSAQVALVFMGVTATTATAAYIMPTRAVCRPQPGTPSAPATAASTPATPAATNLPPGVTPKQVDQPCGRSGSYTYHSWGDWGWSSNRDRANSTGAPPSSVSTALSSSGGRVGAVSSNTSASSSSVARGGFGSIGRGISGGG